MMSDFVICRHRSVKNAAVFTDLKGFDDTYLLHEATPLRADFLAEVACHMNPDFPNDLLLPDNVGNSLQVNLVSEAVHRFLEATGLIGVAYLTIRIDHKGRVASRTHVFVNPVGVPLQEHWHVRLFLQTYAHSNGAPAMEQFCVLTTIAGAVVASSCSMTISLAAASSERLP